MKNQLLKYFLITIFAFGAGSVYTLNFDNTNQTAAVSNSQSEQKITSFALYNADTDKFIQNLEDGSVVDLEKTGDRLAIVAQTSPAIVGSVEFVLTGDESKITSDNNPTYAFPGNSTTKNGANLYTWKAKPGSYNLTARAFTSKSLRGSYGASEHISFILVSGSKDPMLEIPKPPTNIDSYYDQEQMQVSFNWDKYINQTDLKNISSFNVYKNNLFFLNTKVAYFVDNQIISGQKNTYKIISLNSNSQESTPFIFDFTTPIPVEDFYKIKEVSLYRKNENTKIVDLISTNQSSGDLPINIGGGGFAITNPLIIDDSDLPIFLNVVPENQDTQSVLIEIEGQNSQKISFVDNISPFSYPGNSSSSWDPLPGEYKITITPFQLKDKGGIKGQSFVSNFTVKDDGIKIDSTAPSLPSLSVQKDSLTINSVKLLANSTDTESGVSFYSFSRSKKGFSEKIILGNSTTGELSDTGLDSDTEYTYYVTATDFSNNKTSESSINIKTLPQAPVFSSTFKANDNVEIVNVASASVRDLPSNGKIIGNAPLYSKGVILNDQNNGLVGSDGYARWNISFPSLNIIGWVAEKSLLGNVVWLQKYIPVPVYVCSDNIDNDSDGYKDYPNDPGCSSLNDNDEFNTIYNPSSGPVYYIDSVSGNDSNNGTSISTPWKTVNKVNNFNFTAGSSVLFKNGSVFSGQVLDIPSSGNANNWITFASYGDNVNKPRLGGITSNGVSYFRVKDLGIESSGGGNCIVFENGSYAEIDNITATGCGGNGFRMKGTAGSSTPINNVTIKRSFVQGASGATDGITLHRGANYAEAGSFFYILDNVVTGFSEQSLDITAADDVVASGNLLYGSSNSVNIGHGVQRVYVDSNMLDGDVIIKDSKNVSFLNNILLNGQIQINRNAIGSAGSTNLVDGLKIFNNYVKSGGISYASSVNISNSQVRNNIITNSSSRNGVTSSNNLVSIAYQNPVSSYPVGALPSNIWNTSFPENFRQQSVIATKNGFVLNSNSGGVNMGAQVSEVLKDFFSKQRDSQPDIGPVEL